MRTAGRNATCLVWRGGRTHELPPPEFQDIDALRAEADTVVWLQLLDPTGDELQLLQDEFEIHPLAMEDVRKRGQRPKVDTYGDQHMVVVFEAVGQAPAQGGGSEDEAEASALDLAELHAFAGPGWLVTVQWAHSPAVDAASTHFKRGSGQLPVTVGSTLYSLFDAAADSYFPVLDVIAERMDDLEDRILAGDGGSDALREALTIKRQLLDLRRVMAPMREVANALLRRDVPLIGNEWVPYFQDLYDHMVRILDQLDLYRDLLASILDARLTVANNSLNAVMKRLTAITVILMAPTLIAGIYGMNFDRMPELAWPLGYPFALGLMAAVMAGAFVYFRNRDWF